MLSRHVETNMTSGDEPWLFPWSGNKLIRHSPRWRRLRETAGMENLTIHDLRQLCVSGLIAAGCDVAVVQHARGHSTPTVTLNTYSHLWPEAEDRTRTAAAGLMRSALADSVRTSASHQPSDLRLGKGYR